MNNDVFWGDILESENDGLNPNIEDVVVERNNEKIASDAQNTIIQCAQIAVTDLTISNEDFLMLWSCYQAYNQPHVIREVVKLGILDCEDDADITSSNNVRALIDFAKTHPDIVQFNDSLEILKNGDKENQFILDHKDAFLKRCPVQLDIIKEKYWDARNKDEMELSEHFFYLFTAIYRHGAFPQFWELLKPFTCINNNDFISKMSVFTSEYEKYDLNRFKIGDGTMEAVLKALGINTSGHSY